MPWAWAVNGFFTVIGSVGGMILGMALGFTAVFLIAAGCYASALIAIKLGTSFQAAERRHSASLVEAA